MAYCGKGPVPKGKKRGSAEYCLMNNQVRYYGVEKIDKKLLKDYEGPNKVGSYQTELSKYNTIAYKHNKVNKDIQAYTKDLERKKKELVKLEKKIDRGTITDGERRLYKSHTQVVKETPAKIKKLTAQKAQLRTKALAQKERVSKASEIEKRLAKGNA